MKFLLYDLQTAFEAGVSEHPQEQMDKLFKVIHCVPQSIGECWWFCVEEYNIKQLPPYLTEMRPYNLTYWRDGCYKTCSFWQKTKGACCHGGWDCINNYKEVEPDV